MNKKLIGLGIVLSVTFIQRQSFAEDLTQQSVLNKALTNSPLVKEIEAGKVGREADAFDARTLSNPTLDTEYGYPAAYKDQRGDSEISVSLSQPFKLSHGALRNRLSDLLQSTGSLEKQQALLELTAKVQLAYARMWILSERQKVLKEVQPKAGSLFGFVDSGVKQGAYGTGDAAIFKTEVAKAEAETLGIEAELYSAQSDLIGLTGDGVSKDAKLERPELPKFKTEAELVTLIDSKQTKVQERAQILRELANTELQVANKDAFPELRPRLFYSRTNEGADIVGLGISFDLPFYSQNSSERLRKSAEVNAVNAKTTYFQSDAFKTSVLNTFGMYELRRRQLEVYEGKAIPSVRDALKAFETQVRQGQGSVFQLWSTLREYLEVQERYLELWTSAFSESQQLSILIGQEF